MRYIKTTMLFYLVLFGKYCEKIRNFGKLFNFFKINLKMYVEYIKIMVLIGK